MTAPLQTEAPTEPTDLAVLFPVAAILLATSLALAPVATHVVRSICRERVVFFARWGFSHLGLALVLAVLAIAAASRFPVEGVVGSLLVMMLILGLVAAYVVAIANRLQPEGWRALWGRGPGTARAVAAGLATYAMLVPGIFGAQLLWRGLYEAFDWPWVPQEALEAITGLGGPELLAAFVLAVLVQPLLEETLFRGFVQPLLVQNFSDVGGVVLTSVLFASVHGVEHFLPIFCLSLLLGALMLRTRKLASVWFLHGLHNAIALGLVLAAPEAADALPGSS